jgi:hypothetical protein
MLRMEWTHPFCPKLPLKWGGGVWVEGRGEIGYRTPVSLFPQIRRGRSPGTLSLQHIECPNWEVLFFSRCLVLEGIGHWADRTEAEGRNIDEDAIRKMER